MTRIKTWMRALGARWKSAFARFGHGWKGPGGDGRKPA